MGFWWGVRAGSTVCKTPSGGELRTHSQSAYYFSRTPQAAGSSRTAELLERTLAHNNCQEHRRATAPAASSRKSACVRAMRGCGVVPWNRTEQTRHTERESSTCVVRVERYAALRTCSRAANDRLQPPPGVGCCAAYILLAAHAMLCKRPAVLWQKWSQKQKNERKNPKTLESHLWP